MTVLAPAQRRIVVAAMLISTFMAAIEVTVISTAMPTIVARLGGFSLFSWAFGIYLLMQAVTTPLYGRLADMYGRKPVYIGCTALFLVGSLACGLAWSMPSLIVFRALQGLGGGGLAPLATTIIGDVTPPEDRPRAVGYISGIWGIAAIIGPLVGALFVHSLGWPFVFWVNLPIGVTTITLVMRFLKEAPPTPHKVPIDGPGTLFLVIGIGAVMVTLVQSESLSRPEIIGCLAIGAMALALFYRRERGAVMPLLPFYLWRRPLLLAANLSTFLLGAMIIGFTAFLPTWIQGVSGHDALASGLAIGLMTVAWASAGMTCGPLLAKVDHRLLAVGSAAVVVIGSLGMMTISVGQSPLWLYAACLLSGGGMGLSSLVFTVGVQSGVEHTERGRAIALYYFCRLIGQALGAAAFGGVLNRGMAAAGPDGHDAVRALVEPVQRAAMSAADLVRLVGILADALHGVFALSVILSVLMLLTAFLVPRKTS